MVFKEEMNCGSCIHKNVCKYKDRSKNMVKQIKQTAISIGDNSLIEIFNIHELDITVNCIFYLEAKEAEQFTKGVDF